MDCADSTSEMWKKERENCENLPTIYIRRPVSQSPSSSTTDNYSLSTSSPLTDNEESDDFLDDDEF